MVESSRRFVDLSDYDDIMSDLLLDSLYLGFKTHKFSTEYYHIGTRDDFGTSSSQAAQSQNQIQPRRHALGLVDWKNVNRTETSKLILGLIHQWILKPRDLDSPTEELMNLFKGQGSKNHGFVL